MAAKPITDESALAGEGPAKENKVTFDVLIEFEDGAEGNREFEIQCDPLPELSEICAQIAFRMGEVLVFQHGGRIELYSRPDVGPEWVKLPKVHEGKGDFPGRKIKARVGIHGYDVRELLWELSEAEATPTGQIEGDEAETTIDDKKQNAEPKRSAAVTATVNGKPFAQPDAAASRKPSATELDIFKSFARTTEDGTIDATGVLSLKCFEKITAARSVSSIGGMRLRGSIQTQRLDFRTCLIDLLQNDSGLCFTPSVEAAILREIRDCQRKGEAWPSFRIDRDEPAFPFQLILGFHERLRAFKTFDEVLNMPFGNVAQASSALASPRCFLRIFPSADDQYQRLYITVLSRYGEEKNYRSAIGEAIVAIVAGSLANANEPAMLALTLLPNCMRDGLPTCESIHSVAYDLIGRPVDNELFPHRKRTKTFSPRGMQAE